MSLQQKKTVLDSVIQKLDRYYVFPDVAQKIEEHLKSQWIEKKYDTVKAENLFAEMLTADLLKISNDKHLHVNYSAAMLPEESSNPSEMSQAQKEQYANWLLSENYGINKVMCCRAISVILILSGSVVPNMRATLTQPL